MYAEARPLYSTGSRRPALPTPSSCLDSSLNPSPLPQTRTLTQRQGPYENRSIFASLDLAWSLLRIFPRELLRRVTVKTLDEWYERRAAAE